MEQKGRHKIPSKTTPKSKPLIEPFSDLISELVFGKHYTGVFFLQLKSYCRFTPEMHSTTFIHRHRQGT